MALTPEPLILASASTLRAAVLHAAGVVFDVKPADIDETAVKQAHRAAGCDAEACAMALAEAKASAISARHPGILVIGADQILVQGDEWFDKPADLAVATEQLRRLRGREHVLITAVCVYCDSERLWRTVVTPRLTMRNFGDAFLAAYIADEGNAVLGSVGAYRLEGRGVQLFARIDGDYFAILGLPLLDLLHFLRVRGVVGE